jgi:hypothetical protein
LILSPTGAAKTLKHQKTKLESIKIGGGNFAGAAAGGISTFSNISIIITMMKE